VPVALQERVVARMVKAHPYEEVAYDLVPLANPRQDVGLGRIGTLSQSMTLNDFAQQVKQVLGLPVLRMVGDGSRAVSKIAVCGGSGMVAYADAIRHGADCLVTGDVKFHEAQQAHQSGVAVIDAGHFGTEKIMIAELAKRLRALAAEHQYQFEVFEHTEEQDPFITIV
ncbi:MAG: Nif3-like dinuclear metal center hexameric protein, partial [Desulfuromonadales bacterium]|nr:Nif3-like dinuclear metal center hexameric protein [Desulfuromonadales bacterium]